MTRWIVLLVTLADPAAPVASRHVVCMEAEPSEWHVIGDLTPDGAGWRLVESP